MNRNRNLTMLGLEARVASTNSPDETNVEGRGVHVVIDVTSITDTPSVVPHIQGKDGLSGKYYDILVGNAIVATGTTVLKVYPGIVATPAVAASDMLPILWRVRMIHDDGDSITYSVGAGVDN